MSPVEPRLKRIYTEGKKEHLLLGNDANGRPFTPLAKSTLANKKRFSGPPLVPRYSSSRVISQYTVAFKRLPGTLQVIAGWPMEWIRYHREGGKHLPRRDPGGFRDVDRKNAMDAIRDWVWRGEK